MAWWPFDPGVRTFTLELVGGSLDGHRFEWRTEDLWPPQTFGEVYDLDRRRDDGVFTYRRRKFVTGIDSMPPPE